MILNCFRTLALVVYSTFAQPVPFYSVRTVAGVDPASGSFPASRLLLNLPNAIAQAPNGDLYIGDRKGIYRIRSNQAELVATSFGSGGGNGHFFAIDAQGILHYTDNQAIKRLESNGQSTIIAGTQSAGFGGDGGPATRATLNGPQGLGFDRDGNLFVLDRNNRRIRKISASDKTIRTVAGNGSAGAPSGNGGPAIAAGLGDTAQDIAVDRSGSVYVTEFFYGTVRRVRPDGNIEAVAGGPGCTPSLTGLAVRSCTYGAWGITIDSNGVVFVSLVTTSPANLVKIENGNISAAVSSSLVFPKGITALIDGRILVTEENNLVRIVSRDGTVGSFLGMQSGLGDGGPATAATLNEPGGIALSEEGVLYVTETVGRRIRSVSPAGIINTYAGNGSPVTSGDGGNALNAGFSRLGRVRAGSDGTLYVIDDQRVRRIGGNRIISTIAGGGAPGFTGDGGAAVSATLNYPGDVLPAKDGAIFISDTGNCRVRMIRNGAIQTVAGNGQCVDTTYNQAIAARNATLWNPNKLAFTPVGDLLIGTVSRLQSLLNSAGSVHTWMEGGPTAIGVDPAGTVFVAFGAELYSGQPGSLIKIATMSGTVRDLAFDSQGNIFLLQPAEGVVKKLIPNPPVRVESFRVINKQLLSTQMPQSRSVSG